MGLILGIFVIGDRGFDVMDRVLIDNEGWFLIEKDEHFIWVSEEEVEDEEFDTKDFVWRCFYGREIVTIKEK